MLAVALVCRAWRAPAQRVLSDDIVVPTHFKTVPGGPDFFHRIYNGKKWKRDPVVLWEEYTEVCERGTSAFAPPLRAKVRAMDFYRDIDFHTDLTLLDKHSPEFRWCAGVRDITLVQPVCQVRLVEAPGLQREAPLHKSVTVLTLSCLIRVGNTPLSAYR